MMNAYANLRSHRTPIPTPVVVRSVASILVGAAIAVLSTDLNIGVRMAVMIIAIGAAFLLTFSHPYRKEMLAYTQRKKADPPKLHSQQLLTLFPAWLALMTVPLFAPVPVVVSVVIWVLSAAYMFWIFPHFDGSRALAFI